MQPALILRRAPGVAVERDWGRAVATLAVPLVLALGMALPLVWLLGSSFDVAAFAPPGRFYDLAAMHVITESTLRRLQELAPESDFDVRRYRPNVVLADTGSGFVENDWPGREMTLGDDVRLSYTFQTMRCVMTTMAQGDLPDDRNTLRTVARNNRITIEKPEVAGKWACAGVYADVAAGGEVSVGHPHA